MVLNIKQIKKYDLIIFSFAAPIIFLIIKNKYVGIISVIVLSVVSLFGIHLPMNVFYYPMAIVFYLLGAIIGYHFFDFASKTISVSRYASGYSLSKIRLIFPNSFIRFFLL